MKLTIACVFKTGGDFDKEYVDALYDSLKRYLCDSIDFVCITDDPATLEEEYAVPFQKYHLKGWWSKFEAFDLCYRIGSNVLLFDLDTVIQKDITGMVHAAWGWLHKKTIVMLDDFFWPDQPASGIMLLTPQASSAIMSGIDKYRIDRVMQDFRGDQEFLRHLIDQGELSTVRWSNLVNKDYIASYKAHVLGKIPKTAYPVKIDLDKTHIICFHGKPRPKDIKLDKSGVV